MREITVSCGPEADHTQALQQALDGGNCRVILKAGCFNISRTLKLYSHTKIEATEQTLVRRISRTAFLAEDWLLTNADMDKGNENIEIAGGIWDANCAENPRGQDAYDLSQYGGTAINFIGVKGLKLLDLTVANADSYFIRMCRVEEFQVHDVALFNNCPKINQDGVHLNGFCRNGTIRRLRAISPLTPGDDMVALNADDGWERYLNYRMAPGPIENIEIEDLEAESAYTFVRLLSQENLIRNITIRRMRGGVRKSLLNVGRWQFPPGGGNIRDVRVSDVDIHKMPDSVSSPEIDLRPLCLFELKVDNFIIENFKRSLLDGQVADTVRIDNGSPASVEFAPDGTSAALESEQGGLVQRLKYGGFKYFRIDKCQAGTAV